MGIRSGDLRLYGAVTKTKSAGLQVSRSSRAGEWSQWKQGLQDQVVVKVACESGERLCGGSLGSLRLSFRLLSLLRLTRRYLLSLVCFSAFSKSFPMALEKRRGGRLPNHVSIFWVETDAPGLDRRIKSPASEGLGPRFPSLFSWPRQ